MVEPLEPPELFEWFVELPPVARHDRRARSARTPAPPSLKALRANEVVCLLCDRDIGGGGVEVEFFGERTTLPGRPGDARACAPARRSCRRPSTSRPAATATSAVVRPPVADRAPRRACATTSPGSRRTWRDELEDLIRRAPEQWHLFQPNWPCDPGYGH